MLHNTLGGYAPQHTGRSCSTTHWEVMLHNTLGGHAPQHTGRSCSTTHIGRSCSTTHWEVMFKRSLGHAPQHTRRLCSITQWEVMLHHIKNMSCYIKSWFVIYLHIVHPTTACMKHQKRVVEVLFRSPSAQRKYRNIFILFVSDKYISLWHNYFMIISQKYQNILFLVIR